MPILRLQTSWQLDSAFPRDKMVITPHFEATGLFTNADSLCNDLVVALQAWLNVTGEVKVTSYDAQGTPPVVPNGEKIVNPGAVMNTSVPRELALCLSFFSGTNVKRKRGRLYIPAAFLSGSIGLRPSPAQQTKAGALASIFASLGGPDIDWVVYSRLDDDGHKISNWYVDDEWDIQRSRGLRSTSRTSGTTTG